MKRILIIAFLLASCARVNAAYLLIPMDEAQKNHLKAYGVAYYALQGSLEIQWLLNYRGGSFLLPDNQKLQSECSIRGVSFQIIADVQAQAIITDIVNPEVNMDVVKLEKA